MRLLNKIKMTIDTIYALATPPGRSGVAVVRVSGAAALSGAQMLGVGNLTPRMAALVHLRDPVSRETLDKALALYFKNPASYTGEDIIEYHLHGGHAVVQSVLKALADLPAHRMAQPGEFTRRAFENGKMDLTEAEAVADLIDAETAAQKTQALSQMGGALTEMYTGWMESLKKLLAHAEADIEFPDEDLPDGIAPHVYEALQTFIGELDTHLNDNRRGEILRDGVQVAVIGAPNAGKSSLVNALAQREVAIVSDIAGTTRDIIEVHLDIGGYPVILSDTAGLRPDQIGEDGQDSIESEGIRRALARAQSADIKLLVFDAASPVDPHTKNLIDGHSIIVVNKTDLAHGGISDKFVFDDVDTVFMSVQDNTGFDDLVSALVKKAEQLIGKSETPSLTRARHREAVEAAKTALERSINAALPELTAEDMRLAVRHLGRITGRVDVEDLLDVIFKDFCIGK